MGLAPLVERGIFTVVQ